MDHTENGLRQSTGGSRRWPWVVLVLVTVVAFLPTIDAAYLADDYRLFTKPISSGFRTLLRTHQDYMRPLPVLTMRGEFLVWGTLTVGPHVTNLLLHVLTALVVGALARRLTGDGSVAFCSAALFALHPIHAGAVSWLSARFDLCCALLGLSAVLKFDDFLLSAKRRSLVLSLLAFAGALFSKEAAVAFLPILLLWAWARSGPDRSVRWRPLLPFGIVLLLYVCLRMVVTGTSTPLGGIDLTSLGWMWDAIFVPLRLLALPLDEAQWGAWAGPLGMTLLCLLGVTLVLCMAAHLRGGGSRPSRGLVFGFGFALISLVPLAPVVHRLAEGVVPTRLLYTTSAGFCLVVGLWIGRRGPVVRTSLLLGWMLLYGAGLIGNNLAWRRAGELAEQVPRQIRELISRRSDPFRAVLIQDVPRFHNGAYVFLGADLGLALDLFLDREVFVVVSNSKPRAARLFDLREPRRSELWLGYQWDADLEQVVDMTQRLRKAMRAYRAVEHEPQVWRGEELAAWVAQGEGAVSEGGLTVRSESGSILLRSPVIPIGAAALEVCASVGTVGEETRLPQLVLRWSGRS